ncbi:DUF4153 domain-containing protein [Nocardia sp. NPDC127579]|uniref:DUF4153 domain-containing protein n=1 Tax=Nocardia sp. NPDC127579 TaxID=3345402 RepID=UPI0036304E66
MPATPPRKRPPVQPISRLTRRPYSTPAGAPASSETKADASSSAIAATGDSDGGNPIGDSIAPPTESAGYRSAAPGSLPEVDSPATTDIGSSAPGFSSDALSPAEGVRSHSAAGVSAVTGARSSAEPGGGRPQAKAAAAVGDSLGSAASKGQAERSAARGGPRAVLPSAGVRVSAERAPMSGAVEMPAYPRVVLPPQVSSLASRVPLPSGALLAILIAGVAAAVLVPLDRPGIGWVLAGLIAAAGIYGVDWAARRPAVPAQRGEPGKSSTVARESVRPDERAPEDDSPGRIAAPPGHPPVKGAVPSAGSSVQGAVSEGESPVQGAVSEGESPVEIAVSERESSDRRAASAGNPPDSSAASAGAALVGDSLAGGAASTGESPTVGAASMGEPSVTGAGSAGVLLGSGAVPVRESPVTSAPGGSRLLRDGDARGSGAQSAPLVRWGAVWWGGIAVGLLGVGAVRAAEWLFVLCVLGAGVAGSLAVGRRSRYGLSYDVIAVLVRACMAVPWVYHGVRRVRVRRAGAARRVGWSVAATGGLLLVFVPLLAGADAVFAELVSSVTPSWDGGSVVSWVFVFAVAASAVAGALFLLAAPPPPAGDADSVAARMVRKRWSTLEWGLPLGALTVLFAVFVATQLAVLFGGNGYVQRTAELTYAEYARSGFWQLSIVSMLTLGVLAAVQSWGAQESAAERRWLRLAVAAISVLTLVIVASSLHRMWTYQHAYGFTVLRLLVEVFELWIGMVYLLVLASLIRLRRTWIPRAALGAAAATLLVLACVNPEGLIAERNIDRWLAGATVETTNGRQVKPALDLNYLGRLSPDALPATERLPQDLRHRIAAAIRADLDEDPWQGWNLSRAKAR